MKRFTLILVFSFALTVDCFCQIYSMDAEARKKIIGKWILTYDEIGDRMPAYETKTDSIYINFKANGDCDGYLVDPFKKYDGKWVIGNDLLIINYNKEEIRYWFQGISDSALIITISRPHIGSCNRGFIKK